MEMLAPLRLYLSGLKRDLEFCGVDVSEKIWIIHDCLNEIEREVKERLSEI